MTLTVELPPVLALPTAETLALAVADNVTEMDGEIDGDPDALTVIEGDCVCDADDENVAVCDGERVRTPLRDAEEVKDGDAVGDEESVDVNDTRADQELVAHALTVAELVDESVADTVVDAVGVADTDGVKLRGTVAAEDAVPVSVPEPVAVSAADAVPVSVTVPELVEVTVPHID